MLELSADGSLSLMTPTGSQTGARNADLLFQVQAWARATVSWKALDSSASLRLPDNPYSAPMSRWWPWIPVAGADGRAVLRFRPP